MVLTCSVFLPIVVTRRPRVLLLSSKRKNNKTWCSFLVFFLSFFSHWLAGEGLATLIQKCSVIILQNVKVGKVEAVLCVSSDLGLGEGVNAHRDRA